MLAAVVGAAGGGLLLAGPAASASNLIANGTFEGTGSGSLSGWGASGGTLSLVAGHNGGHAARDTASGTAKTYAYTSSKPVKSATAGAAYSLDGFVRSDAAGQTVCLLLKETPSGGTTTVGSAQQCVSTTTAWQAFPTVAYTVKTTGDSLTVNVSETAPASRSFDIDDVSLVLGSSGGGGGGDSGPPSVPQNLQAAAPTASAVNLTWNASTDDVGVTGYDIFRNGSKLTTVGGAATSFQDTGVAASTSYTYTVDAFDAAGHTSAPSAPASVTTPSGGGGGGGGVPCGTAAQSTRPYAHIVVIMDENITYASWQSAADATYTHALASGCRLLTKAAGETHPSFPNYLAVTSGTFETCLGCNSNADNIFHQLNQSGGTWRDYNQSMPKNCSANTSTVPQYRSGHNPAFWFTNLGKNGDNSCSKYDIPADPFMWNDIAADALPDFAWIAPDDCYDMHWMTGTCESVTGGAKADRIKIGDAYIKRVVQAIAATPSYQAGNTLIVVTWDESNEGSVLNKGNWGMDCSNPTVFNANVATCQVPTILVSARIPAGPSGAFYSHYSLTRAFQLNFGLPLLGGATRVATAPID